ncbi:MAG: hypothetical protein KDB90_00245 [Planctomycetes bacterium]|nr:hypothetical protein [Planctomycetota bacterium]
MRICPAVLAIALMLSACASQQTHKPSDQRNATDLAYKAEGQQVLTRAWLIGLDDTDEARVRDQLGEEMNNLGVVLVDAGEWRDALVSKQTGGESSVLSQPTMLTELGKPARIEVGGKDDWLYAIELNTSGAGDHLQVDLNANLTFGTSSSDMKATEDVPQGKALLTAFPLKDGRWAAALFEFARVDSE